MEADTEIGVTIDDVVDMLRLSHDRRFVDCDDRDLTTTPDGDRTVIYCDSCRGVIAKPELSGGDD